jgi:hypothetical protein
MSDRILDNWTINSGYLNGRLGNHDCILKLGLGPLGPYRPWKQVDEDGEEHLHTYCNRAAVMLNRLAGINSPLLSTERISGPNIYNVGHDSFMANRICKNLEREANVSGGQVIELDKSLAQLISNNYGEVIACRTAPKHGHVAWINPGYDPDHPDAPFITNVGIDVKVKPSHESHDDFHYYAFRKKFHQPDTLSSEASWLKNALDTAHSELQPDYKFGISRTTDFLNKSFFDTCRVEANQCYSHLPSPFTDVCKALQFDVNKLTTPHW